MRIQLLAKLLTDKAEQALKEHDLKLWEYDVLSALRRQGSPPELSASELARASMLTSGTITTRIDGLEKRRLVRRRPDPGDRRAILVRLTARGLAKIDDAVAARVAAAEAQLLLLNENQRQQLSSALRNMLAELASEKDAA